jgi:adenosylhomocysteine nucleosidase
VRTTEARVALGSNSASEQLSMKVLVTFAVEAEFAPWRKLRQFSQSNVGDIRAYSAQMTDCELIVLLTGVGGRRAWAEATKVIWDGNVDVCISSGLAGALREKHRPGDVLAAKEIHATNWEKVIPSDSALLKIATACGAKLVDAFHSVDRVLVHSSEKFELGAKADAVEMESGDIMLEAIAFGARVIAIRAISDAVEEDLPVDFNRVMSESGEVSLTKILSQAAAHPGSIPALIRFGWQSRNAAEKLAIVLDACIQRLVSTDVMKQAKEVSAR